MKRRRSARPGRLPFGAIGGVLFVLVLLAPVAAQTVEGGASGDMFRTGDSVEIASGETFSGNLYAFAGTIDVKGTIDGDLFAGAGSTSIDGVVTGDVTVAGGQLTVTGEVQGDIRFAGGQLEVDGPVGGDVAVVGGSVELDGDIGSDVLFGAGQVSVDGDVSGEIFGAAGDYERTGTVSGPEDVTVDVDDEPTLSDQVFDRLYRFATLLVVGALVLLVLRRPLEAVLARARRQPGPSLLTGLLTLVAAVALLVVSIVLGIVWSIVFGLSGLGLVVGTYWFGFIVLWLVVAFTLFLLVIYVAPIVAGLAGARLAFPDRDDLGLQLGALAIGLLIYVVLTAIPVVGGLITAVVVVFAAGAIVRATRRAEDKLQPPLA